MSEKSTDLISNPDIFKHFGLVKDESTVETEQVEDTPEEKVDETAPEATTKEEEEAPEQKPEEQPEVITTTEEEVKEETPASGEEDQKENPSKLKVDYNEWLSGNEDILSEYLVEKKRDYKALPDSEVVQLKLQKDNPSWTADEVSAEMADKYGVGVDKVSIDEEEMSAEEIKEAKRHNSEVDRKLRLLKSEGVKAKDFFEDYKKNITLPEFEITLPEPEEKPTKVEQNDENTLENYEKQVAEYKEKQWVPALKKASETVENLKHSIEIEDGGGKVALDINYKLSDKEKEQLITHLADYVAHPSDERYRKEDGTADLNTFLSDKGKELFFDKMLRSGIKEALAKGRKSVIQNDLLNFDDGVKTKPRDAEEGDKSPLERARDYLLNKR